MHSIRFIPLMVLEKFLNSLWKFTLYVKFTLYGDQSNPAILTNFIWSTEDCSIKEYQNISIATEKNCQIPL